MEGASSPKCVAAVRRDNNREQVRDGIGVDGEWEHQCVFEGKPRCESIGACAFFVRGPYFHLGLTVTRSL